MEHLSVVLTETDRIILESYRLFIEGLSDYLGNGVEIVLHSLENLDHSVIKIINGHYTGRTEGAPITNLALSMLAKIKENAGAPYITYFCKNNQGEPIKSCTIAVFGEHYRIIGLICMNFYLNLPLVSFLDMLTPQCTAAPVSENFANNIDDTIERAVEAAREDVYQDSRIPAGYKNKEIVAMLNEQGIFNLKDAVGTVARCLGISKNTVYLHLRKCGK